GLPSGRGDRSDSHPPAIDGAPQPSRLAGDLQSAVYASRHDDGVLRRHADLVRLRQLSGAPDGRRARYGIPAPERLQLLDERARWAAFVLQLARVAGTL